MTEKTATQTMCARHWTPIARRCSGCPLLVACNAPLAIPYTLADIDARKAQLEKLAKDAIRC